MKNIQAHFLRNRGYNIFTPDEIFGQVRIRLLLGIQFVKCRHRLVMLECKPDDSHLIRHRAQRVYPTTQTAQLRAWLMILPETLPVINCLMPEAPFRPTTTVP